MGTKFVFKVYLTVLQISPILHFVCILRNMPATAIQQDFGSVIITRVNGSAQCKNDMEES